MQSATSVAPGAASGVILSHEMGHVESAEVAAQNNGSYVVSAQVQVYTEQCPECGKIFVAGGKAETVSASKSQGQSQGVQSGMMSKGLVVDRRV